MVALAPNLRSIVNDDGAVILNSARNQITTLDTMGGYVWRKLQDGLSQEQILDHLVTETGEAREVIQPDLASFFDDLASKHLLDSTIEPASPRVVR